jgi:TPR repeat protein
MKGEKDAMNDLADCYKNGEGVEQDLLAALQLYERAAHLGNSYAMNNLAFCYKNGKGVKQDFSKAIRFCEQAIKLGNVYAIDNLADCYQHGKGVEQDLSKAVQLYEQAAQLGNSYSMNNLADCYQHGKGVEQDLNKAIDLYKQAIQRGNSIAMNNLAICYENGIGIEQNFPNAIQFYDKAVQLGNSIAMVNLGDCYQHGKGVKQNLSKAIDLYKQAVQLENLEAMVHLADCYQHGEGVKKSHKQALQLIEKSANLGNSHSMYLLGDYLHRGKYAPLDHKKSNLWLHKAAQKGNVDAISSLAQYYEFGDGLSMNKLSALKLYRRAINNGRTKEIDHLNRCLNNFKMTSETKSQFIKILQNEIVFGNNHAKVLFNFYQANPNCSQFDRFEILNFLCEKLKNHSNEINDMIEYFLEIVEVKFWKTTQFLQILNKFKNFGIFKAEVLIRYHEETGNFTPINYFRTIRYFRDDANLIKKNTNLETIEAKRDFTHTIELLNFCIAKANVTLDNMKEFIDLIETEHEFENFRARILFADHLIIDTKLEIFRFSAFFYYLLAVNQGQIVNIERLCPLIQQFNFSEKDEDLIDDITQLSIQQENINLLITLSQRYFFGIGFPFHNPFNAIVLFWYAILFGFNDFKSEINGYIKKIQITLENQSGFIKRLESKIQQVNINAEILLDHFKETGRVAPVNMFKTITMYRNAINSGKTEANNLLNKYISKISVAPKNELMFISMIQNEIEQKKYRSVIYCSRTFQNRRSYSTKYIQSN